VLIESVDTNLHFCIYEDAFALWDIGLRKNWDDFADLIIVSMRTSSHAGFMHLLIAVPETIFKTATGIPVLGSREHTL